MHHFTSNLKFVYLFWSLHINHITWIQNWSSACFWDCDMTFFLRKFLPIEFTWGTVCMKLCELVAAAHKLWKKKLLLTNSNDLFLPCNWSLWLLANIKIKIVVQEYGLISCWISTKSSWKCHLPEVNAASWHIFNRRLSSFLKKKKSSMKNYIISTATHAPISAHPSDFEVGEFWIHLTFYHWLN